MTEEQKQLLLKDLCASITGSEHGNKVIPHFAQNRCNEHHFDYRGLIPVGLAMEAPKDMYNTKTE